MAKQEPAPGQNRVRRDLRDADRAKGGAPVDKVQTSLSDREPTKHPAKVTVPDLK
jgi:hypothetical protein